MAALYPIYILSHLSQFPLSPPISSPKCSVFDALCMVTLAQNYAPLVFSDKLDSNAESLDPMNLYSIKIKQDGLDFEWTQMKIQGLQNVIIESAEVNKKDNRLRFKMRIPVLTIQANYTSKGFLNNLPFNGQGQNVFTLSDFTNDLTINYDIVKGNDGRDYAELKDYLHWFDMLNSNFYFENVNIDNPVAAIQAEKYLRENWHLTWKQFGRSLWDRFNDKVCKNMNLFFKFKSLEDLVYDYK